MNRPLKTNKKESPSPIYSPMSPSPPPMRVSSTSMIFVLGGWCRCTLHFRYAHQPIFYRVIYVSPETPLPETGAEVSESVIHLSTRVDSATLLLAHPRSFSSSSMLLSALSTVVDAAKYSIAILGGRKELSSKQNKQVYKAMQNYDVDLLVYCMDLLLRLRH